MKWKCLCSLAVMICCYCTALDVYKRQTAERAAAERVAAERATAKKIAAHYWDLSQRERDIISTLGRDTA